MRTTGDPRCFEEFLELGSGSIGYLLTIQTFHLLMEGKSETAGATSVRSMTTVCIETFQAADEARGCD